MMATFTWPIPPRTKRIALSVISFITNLTAFYYAVISTKYESKHPKLAVPGHVINFGLSIAALVFTFFWDQPRPRDALNCLDAVFGSVQTLLTYLNLWIKASHHTISPTLMATLIIVAVLKLGFAGARVYFVALEPEPPVSPPARELSHVKRAAIAVPNMIVQLLGICFNAFASKFDFTHPLGLPFHLINMVFSLLGIGFTYAWSRPKPLPRDYKKLLDSILSLLYLISTYVTTLLTSKGHHIPSIVRHIFLILPGLQLALALGDLLYPCFKKAPVHPDIENQLPPPSPPSPPTPPPSPPVQQDQNQLPPPSPPTPPFMTPPSSPPSKTPPATPFTTPSSSPPSSLPPSPSPPTPSSSPPSSLPPSPSSPTPSSSPPSSLPPSTSSSTHISCPYCPKRFSYEKALSCHISYCHSSLRQRRSYGKQVRRAIEDRALAKGNLLGVEASASSKLEPT